MASLDATTQRLNALIYDKTIDRLRRAPMTLDTLARLRWAAQWLSIVRAGSKPLHGIDVPAEAWVVPPEPVTASRGAWIHNTWRDDQSSDPPYRWHLFTGDLRWRPAWTEVGLSGLCGIDLRSGRHLAVQDEPGASGACLHCVRKSQRSERA